MTSLTTSRMSMPARPVNAVAFTTYCAARAAALAQFMATSRIQPLWRTLTRATDALLAQVAADAQVTLIAIGGYGRGEFNICKPFG